VEFVALAWHTYPMASNPYSLIVGLFIITILSLFYYYFADVCNIFPHFSGVFGVDFGGFGGGSRLLPTVT
jgi:hypothetical protein